MYDVPGSRIQPVVALAVVGIGERTCRWKVSVSLFVFLVFKRRTKKRRKLQEIISNYFTIKYYIFKRTYMFTPIAYFTCPCTGISQGTLHMCITVM